MAFFTNWFKRPSRPALPTFPPHMGAGCVFTDGKHILAGYQPHKKIPSITGIGGHREGEETYLETAYRETVEEIFHVSIRDIPKSLIPKLIQTLYPKKVEAKKDYVMVFLDFQDLLVFLKICKKSGLRSPLYKKLPKTLLETLQMRETNPNAEISMMCLLPVVYHVGKPTLFVNPYFVNDLRSMCEST